MAHRFFSFLGRNILRQNCKKKENFFSFCRGILFSEVHKYGR